MKEFRIGLANFILITVVLISFITIQYFISQRKSVNKNVDKVNMTICPDEMIVDKMPSVIDDSGVIPPPKAYYIKDGKRVEVSDYDAVWINTNCKVPVLEVE